MFLIPEFTFKWISDHVLAISMNWFISTCHVPLVAQMGMRLYLLITTLFFDNLYFFVIYSRVKSVLKSSLVFILRFQCTLEFLLFFQYTPNSILLRFSKLYSVLKHRRRTRGGRGGLSPPSYQTQGARGGPSGGARGGS